jgi:hypothetical protein
MADALIERAREICARLAEDDSQSEGHGRFGGEVYRDGMMDDRIEVRAAIAALNSWQDIETAPKDGTRILAVYQTRDGEGYAARLHGREFVVWHEGVTDNGYDLGWALFPGFGGVPDKCLSRWAPLPPSPVPVSGEGLAK